MSTLTKGRVLLHRALVGLQRKLRVLNLLRKRQRLVLKHHLETVNLTRPARALVRLRLLPAQIKIFPLILLAVLMFQILSPAVNLQKAFALNGDTNQNGYIWENDDGSTVDGNSQLAAGNASVFAPKGSRLNLRMHLKNTGAAMDLSKLGLFYDQSNGMWSKVRTQSTASNPLKSMTATSYPSVDNSASIGQHSSVAVDSGGTAWVASNDGTNLSLRVAKYVGSGGNCTDAAWNCSAVDDTGTSTGQYTSIAIDNSGSPWVSYYDTSNTALRVAKYVGSGGNCTDTAWNCSAVDNIGTSTGLYTSIAIDNSGNPWVAYQDISNSALRVAKYVGSGGNCTDTAWNCSAVEDTASLLGSYTSIAIDNSGNPWVAYYDSTNTALRLAKYVGSGGNCTDTAWNCSAVDNTGTATGQYSGIAIDNSGNPWISFYDTTNTALRVAKYVGSGGNCTDTAWNCSAVDNTGTATGQFTDIAMDPSGNPLVSYWDTTARSLRVAKYVGSGGNCTDTAWSCSVVDMSGDSGQYSSIAIDRSGNTWISFYNAYLTSLGVVKGKSSNIVTRLGNGCSHDNEFLCTTVDNTGTSTGWYMDSAVDQQGNTWISYYDSTNTALKVAKYVGSGGNCTDTAWSCWTVDNSGADGTNTSIAIDSNGVPWVSYTDANPGLGIAKYVGSGGNCTDAAWSCTLVYNSSPTSVTATSIAIDASNNIWVAFADANNTALRVAKYVGSGGSCTDAAWNCPLVDNTADTGESPSIAIDNSGNPWISFYDTTNTALRVAKYVGSGGNCTDTAWNCSNIDNTGTNTGINSSLAIDASGTPWISFYDTTDSALRVAKYVGSGGNCTDTAWNCSQVDNNGTSSGNWSGIVFGSSNQPVIFYLDTTSAKIRIAKYVGSGGNCTDTAWDCANTLDRDISGTSVYTSPSVTPSGKIVVAYYDANNTSVEFAELSSRGDVLAVSGSVTGSLSESHADMTTTADTANRDDADCIGGGTWNNGYRFSGDQGLTGTLPDGSGTPQCTEIMFTLDFSQAQAGVTYRFVLSSYDPVSLGQNYWRGPVSVASGAYASITITDASYRFSKDNAVRLSNCNDTAWGCGSVLSSIGSASTLGASSMGIDPAGTPWVAVYGSTSGDLVVAKYVGTGGSGCTSSAWTCTTVDSTNDVGKYPSIAFDTSGNPWVSHYDTTGGNLRVAKYVGSGGSGCASSAWTCTAVETTNDVGQRSSIIINASNNPVVTYYDTTNGDLRMAKYLGGATTGTGCAVNTWMCTAVDSTNNVGSFSSIGINDQGQIWVSYYDTTNTTLRVARNVGAGGSGCAIAEWSCVAVETAASGTGQYNSLSFDSSGSPWVGYYDATNSGLRVAKFVSTGGSGCSSSAWTCTAVDTSNDVGSYSSIAFDSAGNPWVSYLDATSNDMRVARYVTSGGSGCASSAWTCSSVETTGTVGIYTAVSFDQSGSPWVAYMDTTNRDLRVAKMHRSPVALSNASLYGYNGRSARNGDARYRLTLGKINSAADGTCGTGTADYYGICGLFHESGDYDSITAQANESPYLTFAMRYDSTSELPTVNWVGKTTLAPNTAGTAGDLTLQVYRAGSTNAWETIASDTASSGCSSDNCRLSGIPSGTASDYFSAADSDGKYWVYFRLYQDASSSTSITLSTDSFRAAVNSARLGTSTFFVDGVRRPLNAR